jgi:alpha-amylase
MHAQKVHDLFGVKPSVFRNTELSYNNEVAQWAESAGYKGVLAEGWDPVLGWRSPNFVYRPPETKNIKLLLKNYKLSDDIAFRFGDREWSGWPLTADKFTHWLRETQEADVFNLFMDYETFGEHQWEASGIFDFLDALPEQWLAIDGNSFMTVSEACDAHEPSDVVDVPNTTTWADSERDLSAWLGNPMQQEAITALYELESPVLKTDDLALIEDWRKLQTSDHFYYMCTKWWNDGDIHAYFSPYDSPFEAYINFMNAYHDVRHRIYQHGVELS